MTLFWVSVEVRLETPIALVDERGSGERARLVGFVQELGCTAESEEAMRAAVCAHIAGYDLGPGQKTRVQFDEVESLSREELEEELAGRTLQDPALAGVWFTTGRSFFSEDG